MNETLLIAVDLDGTALNSRKALSRRTKQALYAAREAGHTVVVATGRPPRSSLPFHRELRLDTPIITLNGCFVFVPASGRTLSRKYLPLTVAQDLVACAKDFGLQNALAELGEDYALQGASRVETWIPAELSSPGQAHAPIAVGDFSKVLKSDPETLLLQVSRRNHADFLAASASIVAGAATLRAWRDPHDVIEVMPAGVSKATALADIAKELGFTQEQTLAFGDEANDYELLKFAQTGVAMGNANPILLDVASAITDSCDNDGLAKYLEEHILSATGLTYALLPKE